MAASSSSSSYRIPRSLHDVFLSFHGADTRNGFTSHLFAALNRQGISTFRDDTELPRGENISSQLVKAIEESRVSIVVFSSNYAASKWCLDELVKIMECRRDFKQIVLPIFYHVDPSHFRTQGGYLSEAFEHENWDLEGTLSVERMKRWRVALKQAADLSGYHLRHGDEAKLINKVVEDTAKRLDWPYLYVADADHLVGFMTRVQNLEALLNLESHGVLIIAIWGAGGIGKTTIAKAIFNSIRNEFEGCSFLADVSENTKNSLGVVTLQKQLLCNILMTETFNLDNQDRGIEVIKQKLCNRRVLLVLDDVDNIQQLKSLGIDRHMFSSGSRIIITTRNESSILSLQVDSVYSPEYLDEGESLTLFSLNAFRTHHPRDGYWELSKEVVAYAGGLPLALAVLGSSLFGRSEGEWQSAIEKLKIIPHVDIYGKLKISFDSLDDKEKELFLDIAFFFIGKDKDFMVKVLEEESECFPVTGIAELARRCLLGVDLGNRLRMHDLVRGMGREIVRGESLKEPGERSRLWHSKEILQILTYCTGTKAIEGICLELPTENSERVNVKAFKDMNNLRLLHLSNLQHGRCSFKTTFRRLKWLCWHGFPFTYISADLCIENLVALDLQYSKLKQVWKGPKRLEKLKFLNVSHSYYLTKTPDFSGLKSLEMLLLDDCTSLVKVHNSIGNLDKLLILNIANCINLTKVPSSLFLLKSLEKLDCSGCSKLGEIAKCKLRFPMFRQQLKSRQNYISISKAPIQGLSCLRKLNLENCNMEHVPSEIGSLIGLQDVNLSGNKFCSFPSSFSHLSSLRRLKLNHCAQIKSLVNLPNKLQFIGANHCISLETASDVGSVMRLELTNCPKFKGKSLGNNFKRNIIRQQVQGGFAHSYRTLVYPGKEIPYNMEFQDIGTKSLSFVVPSFVGKKITGLIVCAVLSYYKVPSFLQIINKSMGKSSCNYVTVPLSWRPGRIFYEDHVFFGYGPLHPQPRGTEGLLNFTLEGADEVDLFVRNANGQVKRLGLSLIYEDDNKYLEPNIWDGSIERENI